MTTPATMTNCPTDETLAAFIDDRLDADERKRVFEHLATCGQCRDVVLSAGEIANAEHEARGDSLSAFRSRNLYAAAALAAAAVLIVLFGPMIRLRFFPSGFDTIAEATQGSEFRTVSARLPGELKYHPYRARVVMRSERGGFDTNPDEELSDLQLRAASAQLEEAAKADPNVDNLHALAVSRLLLGENARAVAGLERAVMVSTGETVVGRAISKCSDPALLTSLAAAYLNTRAEEGRHQIAMDASERAVQLAPRSAPALFNRAIALETMGLRSEAVKAWETYLSVDPTSAWSVEAQEHLANLK